MAYYYVPSLAPVYALADPEHDRTALSLAARDMQEKEEVGRAAQRVVEKQKEEAEAKEAADAERAAAEAAAEKAREAEDGASAAQQRAAESKQATQEQLDQYSAHARSPQRVRLVGGYPVLPPPPVAVYPSVYCPYYAPVVAPVYAVPDPAHEAVGAGLAQQFCAKKKEEEEAEAAAQEAAASAAAAKEEADARRAAAEAAEERSRAAKEAKDAEVDEFAAQRKKNQDTELECVVHASSPRRVRLVPAYPPIHYAVIPPPPPPAAATETEFAQAIRERDEACERASVARARADPTTA